MFKKKKKNNAKAAASQEENDGDAFVEVQADGDNFDGQDYERQGGIQQQERASVILPDRSILNNNGYDGGAVSENFGPDDAASRLYSILVDAVPLQRQAGQQNQFDMSSTELNRRRDNLELVWKDVRKWFEDHPSLEDRAEAACVRGEGEETPLHLLCKLNNPPMEFIEYLLEAAVEVASWADSVGGWLPLHLACASSLSSDILMLLIQAYPDGKTTQDIQNRTPLHFCATHVLDSSTECLQELCSTGAAQLTDFGGMLPMHYACAYGTSPDVLKVLADAYPLGVIAREQKGRTPMHLAMSNAQRGFNSGVIQFLIEYKNTATVPLDDHYNLNGNHHPHHYNTTTTTLVEGKQTVDMRDMDGYLPLQLLVQGLNTKGNKNQDREDYRKNISECLSLYLEGEPKASADFLTALQDLPTWALDVAVTSNHVRKVLNKKIKRRFHTCILMLDGYMLIVIIVCFEICSRIAISQRYGDNRGNAGNFSEEDLAGEEPQNWLSLAFLFLGVVYFISRELIQVISLITLGNFTMWFEDFTNWLDMCVIVLVSYYGILFIDPNYGADLDVDSFRIGVTCTKGVLWCAVIYYLKSTLVDFAVFVGGVFYVVGRLIAFLLSVIVILFIFAQMFYFLYQQEDICTRNFAYTVTSNFTTNDVYLQPYNATLHQQYNQTIEYSLDKVILNCTHFNNMTQANETEEVPPVMSDGNFTIYEDGGLFLNRTDDGLEYPEGVEMDSNPCMCAIFPHCEFDHSLTKVYTMMIGEIAGEIRYYTSPVAQVGYVVYAFLVVILLSNVLIAIVTDLYEIIQNDRAAVVFWQNRLDFVAEMDAISYGIQKRAKFLFCCCVKGIPESERLPSNNEAEQNPDLYYDSNTGEYLRHHHDTFRDEDDPFYELWESLREFLFDDAEDADFGGDNGDAKVNCLDLEFYTYYIYKIASIIIIPLWLLLGAITAGWLWPPQVREYLFAQEATVISRAEMERKKLEQLREIDKQIKLLQQDMLNEMIHDRDDLTRVKDDFDFFQMEVLQDLLQIKELMSTLLDMGSHR